MRTDTHFCAVKPLHKWDFKQFVEEPELSKGNMLLVTEEA